MQKEQQSSKKTRGGNRKQQAPLGFYTAREAAKKLGLNSSTFHAYVKDGKIKKHVPPLKSNGYYDKKEIDELATELALFFHTHTEEPHITKRVARPEDVQGIHDVLAEGFGWQTAEVSQRLAWYRVNPYIDYVILWHGNVAGYITAVPYVPDTLEAMMAGRKRAWHITPIDILPYEKGKYYSLYVGVAVRKDVPSHTIFTVLASRLIAGFMTFLQELAAQGIFIQKMYAASAEDDGQRLCKALGFMEQAPKEGDLWVDGKRLMRRYVLDLETSDSRFAQQYREALAKGA